MSLSSPGIGSGLDINSIVSQLMEVEQQPLIRLNQQEAIVRAEISAYGALKGEISSLQSSLTKLEDAVTFQATSATTSDSAVLTASSDVDAVPSSYRVDVDRLAQQHKLGSGEFAPATTFGGAAGDAVTITVGTQDFDLDLSTAKTLTGIQELINADSNETGVTAGLITGDSGNQTLVLTSGETGFDNRIQLTFGGSLDASTFNFSMLNRDADDQLLATENELDASLTVDGVTVTRSDNKISDVVEGLTLTLKTSGLANVSISGNTSVARGAVEEFVNAHNQLKQQIGSLSSSGLNASLLRNVESKLRGVFNDALSGLGDYSYIAELGVTTNSDTGLLQFDSEAFTTALEENPDSVAAFFSDKNKGFAQKMESVLERFQQPGGTIDGIVNGANNTISSIERNRDVMERRLDSIEKRYLAQFGALDTLMASFNTTSEFLTTQLDALSNLATGNRN